jgi:preprotein translocase subunit Sec63
MLTLLSLLLLLQLRKAQAALKQAKRKDYYKILGVARGASEDEIKKGYRKAALK